MSTFINNRRLAGLAGVEFSSEEIKPGPIVYSRTHTVVSQFDKLATFPECVLVTSFSDACVTKSMTPHLPSNVRMWFSNNVKVRDPRVTAVPIGIRTSPEGEEKLRAAIRLGRGPDLNLVYLNCWRRLRRTPNPRRGIYEQFGSLPWVTSEGGFSHVPMERFYEQICCHPYTLSPPGAGPDCHRHWEAIMLGSIPIVLKGVPTDILEGLPCLRVHNWGEVTEERLLRELPALQEKFVDNPLMERVWFEYWEKRIKET